MTEPIKTQALEALREAQKIRPCPMFADAIAALEAEQVGKWCSYCRKTDHSDAECHSTRAATAEDLAIYKGIAEGYWKDEDKASATQAAEPVTRIALDSEGMARDAMRMNLSATQAAEPQHCSQADLNAWFLALPEKRQHVLIEDKWLLASAAFEAGKRAAHPPVAQPLSQQDIDEIRIWLKVSSPVPLTGKTPINSGLFCRMAASLGITLAGREAQHPAACGCRDCDVKHNQGIVPFR